MRPRATATTRMKKMTSAWRPNARSFAMQIAMQIAIAIRTKKAKNEALSMQSRKPSAQGQNIKHWNIGTSE